MNKGRQWLIVSIGFVVLVFQFLSVSMPTALMSRLDITVGTDKSSYYVRDLVQISGTLLDGGQPATGYLVGVQVNNRNGYPLFFRTIPIGTANTSVTWPIRITDVHITDSFLNMTDTIPLNQMMNLYTTVKNVMITQYNVLIVGTVFDGNLIPVSARQTSLTVGPNQTQTLAWSFWIPEWAFVGKAFAAVSVYSDLPENGGIPYTPEAQYVFYLTRNPSAMHPYSILPVANTSTAGHYQINVRMPPDRYTLPGDYQTEIVALSASNQLFRTHTSGSFSLAQYSVPPNAAFTFTPLQVYQNMTITLDGSSSSAEGYNDTLIQYDWTINDPYNPAHIIKTGNFTNPPDATATHAFSHTGTFTVQLNVTDNEGSWSATIKPINVLTEYGPKGNFTWAPQNLVANRTVTFDASQSQLGWSAQLAAYAPIVSYTWDFNDGTPGNVTANNTITYKFSQMGNYTVALTVTDSVGRTNSTSAIIRVSNFALWDLNQDGKTDMKDVASAARAFGTRPGDPLWNPVADITGPGGVPDGKVDMRDISLVARHFGESSP